MGLMIDPYSSDQGYFRWLMESSYGSFLEVKCATEGHQHHELFPPLCCKDMPYYTRMRELIADYLVPRSGLRLLDCGCGLGRLSFDAAAAGHDVLGIDTSTMYISFCRQLKSVDTAVEVEIPGGGNHIHAANLLLPPEYRSRADAVGFEVGDVLNLEYGDSTFSNVVSSNVVDRVQSPGRAIADMYRVLVRGGLMAISSPLDWRVMHTPEAGSWVESLEELLPSDLWQVVLREKAVRYEIRISDRLVENYYCEIVLAEKR